MKHLFLLIFSLILCGSIAAQDGFRVYNYNGPGNGLDQSRAISVDDAGNFYVTGNSYGGATTDMDYCTIKYNRYDGARQVWVARFNGTGSYSDQANAITTDKFSNVYVTGWAHMEPVGLDCGTIDYVTIKYNSDGVQQWMQVYNGPASGSDYANALVIDNNGNLYVTGASQSSSNGDDIATIKYNKFGVQQWVARYNGASNGSDWGRAIAVDSVGNVYVCGDSYQSGQGADYITIKYNASGVQQWAARYNGTANGNDTAFSVAVDRVGNVLVTGTAKNTSSNQDYVTIKYSPSGTQLWKQTYNGPGNGIDESRAMELDYYNNIYITGYSMGTNYDYATIKYNADGSLGWVSRYNGPANLNDKAWGMTISTKLPAGQKPFYIYVTGQSQGVGSQNDYLSIKYTNTGDTVWTKRYNSTANGDDVPSSIAVIASLDYIFVTGTSENNYLSIMYYPKIIAPSDNMHGQQIMQNYPNPFNPTTTIEFNLTSNSDVSLKVYNMLGSEVAVLANQKMEAGPYQVNWNASEYPSGTYFYTLVVDGVKIDTKRMLLIK